MKIILLLPLVLFLILVVFNLDLLNEMHTIDFFALHQMEIPVFLYLAIFMVAYIAITFLFYDIANSLLHRKINRMDTEILKLKSDLYDEHDDELTVFVKEQRSRLDNFLKSQDDNFDKLKEEFAAELEKYRVEQASLLQKQKAESTRIVEKLGALDTSVMEKIKGVFKS